MAGSRVGGIQPGFFFVAWLLGSGQPGESCESRNKHLPCREVRVLDQEAAAYCWIMHFTTVTTRDMEDYLENVLPEVLEQGRPLIPVDRSEPIDWQAADAPPWLGLRYPHEGPLALLAVCRRNQEEGGADLRTFYPAALDGNSIDLQVTEIHEDHRAGEAIITARSAGGLELRYFEPLYCTSRPLYREGVWLRVGLSGLALKVSGADPDEEGQGRKSCLLQTDDDMPDAGSFRCRVDRVGYLELFEEGVYRLEVTLDEGTQGYGDPAAGALLYVGEHQLKDGTPPAQGDMISGALWLQGVARKVVEAPSGESPEEVGTA